MSLKQLTRLKILSVQSRTIGDGGMAHLAGLTALREFTPMFPITDRGLSHLSGMNHLDHLQLIGDFTDEGLRQLQDLKALRQLAVTTGNDIRPETLQSLRDALPALDWLRYTKTRDIKSRPKTGQAAPAFSVQTIDGKPLRLRDYRGKTVLVYFWATWCSPCVAWTPTLKQLHEELSQSQGFATIGLSLDEEDNRLRQHVESYKLGWPQVRLGLNSEVAANYGVSAVPACFLVGPDGSIIYTGLDAAEIRTAVNKVLKTSAGRK